MKAKPIKSLVELPAVAPAISLAIEQVEVAPVIQAATLPVVETPAPLNATPAPTPLHLRTLEAWRELHKEAQSLLATAAACPNLKQEIREEINRAGFKRTTVEKVDWLTVFNGDKKRAMAAKNVCDKRSAIVKAEEAFTALLSLKSFRFNDIAQSAYDNGRADGKATVATV